ncbi:transposase [Ktedonobacter sp. SOSP1-52]|nr:transposase [Ktedonobacter sp. SOSP1-52]
MNLRPHTTINDLMRWSHQLSLLHARIAPHFARPEPRRRALAYLQGLLSAVERKNSWQMAEHAQEARPYGMQRLLVGSVWNADRVRDDIRAYVVEHFGEPQAILAIDETSFPKRGCRSAGVQVQYCGTTGQVQNCQVGVFLSYVSSKGHALIDRELYLPLDWCEDARRCQEADILLPACFRTKPELAVRMLERACSAQLPFSWVVADSVYGGNDGLRVWLEEHQTSYVLAVPCFEPVSVRLPDGCRRQIQVREAPLLPGQQWQRLSQSQGSKGPRLFDWMLLPLLHQWQDDACYRLLVRRSITDPSDLAFFLVFAPPKTSLMQLVRVIGMRWHIEEHFQASKDLGLDHYQVRSSIGWYRHVTLVLLAHAFLRVICAQQSSPSSLAALTIPEVRHLLGSLLWFSSPQVSFILTWSAWRRKHRHRASHSHQLARFKAG